MNGGEDAFWAYAHGALQNHNILPNDWLKLPVKERIFIAASDALTYENVKVVT